MKDWDINADKILLSGISPDEWARVAGVIQNTLADHTDLQHGDGVRSGWRLYADKTVGAGEGWISGAHGRTVARQAVEEISLGGLNFVFAQATYRTPDWAQVRFVANPVGIAYGENYGGCFLGTYIVDAAGVVTHINDIPVAESYEEHIDKEWCRRLQFEAVDIPAFELVLTAGHQVIATIPHPAKRFRGAGTLTIIEEPDVDECPWIADLSPKDAIKVLATNMTNYMQTFRWELRREGLAE